MKVRSPRRKNFIAYPMHDFPGIEWQNTTFMTGQSRIGMEGVEDGSSDREWVAD